MPQVVITGGTGFIGRSLANQLRESGYTCTLIGRSEPKELDGHAFARWDGRTFGDWARALEEASAVVNLAGRTVDCIKSPDNIDQILRSRIESTAAVGEALTQLDNPPHPVNNKDFMKTLRQAAGIPIGLPAPEMLVRFGATNIFRTDPELALYGRYVVPQRLLNEGFAFRFPELKQALEELMS